MVHLGNDWDDILKEEFQKEYYQKIRRILRSEYQKYRIFPDMHDIFNALKYTPFEKVKAVIIGQDPYHEIGQAHGLSFSVQKGIPLPPSLQNIYKELKSDLGIEPPAHGDLSSWAHEGVLLLNATLTVREGMANSHQSIGWQIFTDNVIRKMNEREKPCVFLLWGSHAIAKRKFIDESRHLVLTSPHPSPLSAYRGFFGCNHFIDANRFLAAKGMSPIDWTIQEE